MMKFNTKEMRLVATEDKLDLEDLRFDDLVTSIIFVHLFYVEKNIIILLDHCNRFIASITITKHMT